MSQNKEQENIVLCKRLIRDDREKNSEVTNHLNNHRKSVQ